MHSETYVDGFIMCMLYLLWIYVIYVPIYVKISSWHHDRCTNPCPYSTDLTMDYMAKICLYLYI